jgi:hypothetical protein
MSPLRYALRITHSGKASLSTQSLNQFAECMSNAEALSAEIAIIHNELRGNDVSALALGSTQCGEKRTGKKTGMTRSYTPVRL